MASQMGMLVALLAIPVNAQHRIQLEPSKPTSDSADRATWFPKPLQTYSGTIDQIDERQISILVSGQSVPERFAIERLIHAELTSVPESQKTAIDAFKEKRFTESLTGLIECVSQPDPDQRPPVWRQQWLSMLASQAAMRSGRGEIALELVKQLDARPMPSFVMGLLPVDWNGSTDPNLFDSATKMAASESLAVKLVAASWLLRSPKYRPAAEVALARLAKQNEHPAVAMIASQLLWQSKSPTEIRDEWSNWKSQWEKLPMALQAGPLISMLVTAKRLGMSDEAKELELCLRHSAPTWHPDLP